MKCFIHHNEEAVAACKKCGKGMCSNCSAYGGHTGVCPACKKKDYQAAVQKLNVNLDNYKTERGWYIFKTIVFCWTIIYLIYGLVKIVNLNSEIQNTESNIKTYNTEIAKLDKALSQGIARI